MKSLLLKRSNFKVLLIIAFTLLFSIRVSFSQNKDDTLRYKKYIPDYLKLQFAGGIGILSPGFGYTFFNHQLDISLFYGYIPEYFTVSELHSISLQFTVKLLKFKLNKNIEILPLNVGVFTHHTFGNEFWIKLPKHYPKGYYWWYPGINAGAFIGGEIKTKLLANKTPGSGTAFYTRIGTRGFYIASKMGNSSIPVKDIIEIGFGVAIYR